jgi:hypothetical protein
MDDIIGLQPTADRIVRSSADSKPRRARARQGSSLNPMPSVIAGRLLPLSTSLLALGALASAAQAQVVRDSSGIRVVTFTLPTSEQRPSWRLDAEPLLVLGNGEDVDREFNSIKGGAILSDGSILAINGRPIDFRIFAPSGALVRRFGRVGSGPGEFRMIATTQRVSADTILIFDRSLRRVTLASLRAASAAKSVAFAPPASATYPMGLHTVVGRMANGSYIAMGPAESPSVTTGLATPRFRLVVVRPSMDSAIAVGDFDGDDVFFAPGRGGGQTFGAPAFGRISRVLVGQSGFYVARSDRLELFGYDAGGTLRTVLRSRRAPILIRAQDIAHAVDSAVRANGTPREAEMAKATQFKTMPAFHELQLDQSGRLWVREAQARASTVARWNVIDSSGALQGSIDLPTGANIIDVSGDKLLLLTSDNDGVERLELRRIQNGR